MGVLVGILSALVSLLVGLQIYKSVENAEKIKKLGKSQEEIRGMIEKFNSDSESFILKSECLSKMAHAFALNREQPFSSYRIMLYALVDALNMEDPDFINSIMNNLETLKNSIVKMENNGVFNKEGNSQMNVDLHHVKHMIDSLSIEGEGLFPLISKRLLHINKEVSDAIERIAYNYQQQIVYKTNNYVSNNDQHD